MSTPSLRRRRASRRRSPSASRSFCWDRYIGGCLRDMYRIIYVYSLYVYNTLHITTLRCDARLTELVAIKWPSQSFRAIVMGVPEMRLGHVASALRFWVAAIPASDTSTHLE